MAESLKKCSDFEASINSGGTCHSPTPGSLCLAMCTHRAQTAPTGRPMCFLQRQTVGHRHRSLAWISRARKACGTLGRKRRLGVSPRLNTVPELRRHLCRFLGGRHLTEKVSVTDSALVFGVCLQRNLVFNAFLCIGGCLSLLPHWAKKFQRAAMLLQTHHSFDRLDRYSTRQSGCPDPDCSLRGTV